MILQLPLKTKTTFKMKTNNLIIASSIFLLSFTFSCKDSSGEKLEDRMATKAEKLENRAEDLEEASDYVSEGFDDMEEAIDNFRQALEEVDNAEDRKAIRKRINEIMDTLEMNKN